MAPSFSSYEKSKLLAVARGIESKKKYPRKHHERHLSSSASIMTLSCDKRLFDRQPREQSRLDSLVWILGS
jgi:hypothetical protein